MTNDLMDLGFEDDWLEFEGISTVIPLDSEFFEQALAQSRRIGNEMQQWPIYLQWLALLGFERWLQLRMPEVRVDREGCSLLRLGGGGAIAPTLCNLTVGSFNVCLVPTICLADEAMTISRAAIDLPEFAAQFYIAIGIKEEAELATILGWLRYDQLRQQQQHLQPDIDWTYSIPAGWFNRDSDALLLELQCLDPLAVPLPAIPTDRRANLARMQTELEAILPHLQNRLWWQVMSWEQGAAVLASPALFDWLHQAANGNQARHPAVLRDLLQLLTQRAINVARWFQNQMEDNLQTLSWQLLPAPSLRLKERIRFEALEAMLREIERRTGAEIPATARTALQDFSFSAAAGAERRLSPAPYRSLRLYALTWLLPETGEWMLLLILGAPPEQPPPHGVKLRLSDPSGVLVEERLQAADNQDYFFAQVSGTLEEVFLATITSADGESQVSRLFECRWE